jgi:hypothetical protein
MFDNIEARELTTKVNEEKAQDSRLILIIEAKIKEAIELGEYHIYLHYDYYDYTLIQEIPYNTIYLKNKGYIVESSNNTLFISWE